jgi:hypothetical protein
VELLGLTLVLNDDHGFVAISGLYLERPVLHVFLDLNFTEISTNESLGVENSVFWVSGNLILCGITNETLPLSKSDI